MTLALAGDLVVAVLLIVTIVYSAVLNRRLAALRADKAELHGLVDGLAKTTASAGAGIATLKAAAETVGRELEARRATAQALRDDLAYLIECGNSAADRLEGGIRAQRQAARPSETPAAPAPTIAGAAAARAERDLMRAPAPAPTPVASAAASRAERDLMRALSGQR